jgi:short-subunit dehydrogenase/acyl carrier protein
LHEGQARRKVALPHHPFQRQVFWLPHTPRALAGDAARDAAPANASWPYGEAAATVVHAREPGAVERPLFLRAEWVDEPLPDVASDGTVGDGGHGGGLLALAPSTLHSDAWRALQQATQARFTWTEQPSSSDLPEAAWLAAQLDEAWAQRQATSTPEQTPFKVALLWPERDTERVADASLLRGGFDLAQVVARQAARHGGTPVHVTLVLPAQARYGAFHEQASPDACSLLGTLRAAALERLNLSIRCVHVDTIHPPTGEALHAELMRADKEEAVFLGLAERRVARLRHSASQNLAEKPWQDDASWCLITGGTGALGMATLGAALANGLRRFVLVARGIETPPAVLDALRMRYPEADIRLLACDVADAGQVRALVSALRAQGITRWGLVHAAGGIGVQTTQDMDFQGFMSVFAGKALGLSHLVDAAGSALAWVWSFSSIASVWGSPKQAHYMAANLYLDSYCARLRSRGVPVWVCNWGPWYGGGMASGTGVSSQLANVGIDMLRLDGFSDVLDELGRHGPQRAAITVVKLDAGQFAQLYGARGGRLLRELEGASAPGPQAEAAWDTSAMSAESLRAALREALRQGIKKVTGGRELAYGEEDTGFLDLGLDSLMALQLKRMLEARTGLKLASTLVFDHPTVHMLVEALVGMLKPEALAEEAVATRPGAEDKHGGAEAAALPGDEDIARELDRLFGALGG